MKKNFIKNMLLLGLFVFVMGTASVFAGTATATDTASDGDDCGKISKQRNQTTGAMEVLKVEVNGVKLAKDEYTVSGNGSTRPKIEFTDPLNAGDTVKVTLRTKKSGRFTVNLELYKCR